MIEIYHAPRTRGIRPIWACEELPDEPCDAAAQERLEQTQAKILQRLLVILHGHDEAQSMLQGEHWQGMSAQDFSFAVAGLLSLPSDMAQTLLEMTRPQARLDNVLAMLNQIGPNMSG